MHAKVGVESSGPSIMCSICARMAWISTGHPMANKVTKESGIMRKSGWSRSAGAWEQGLEDVELADEAVAARLRTW